MEQIMEDRNGVDCMLQPTIYHMHLLDATSWKPGLGQLSLLRVEFVDRD